MPDQYIADELPLGWVLELGNPHPNIITIFRGDTPSEVMNLALDYAKLLEKIVSYDISNTQKDD